MRHGTRSSKWCHGAPPRASCNASPATWPKENMAYRLVQRQWVQAWRPVAGPPLGSKVSFPHLHLSLNIERIMISNVCSFCQDFGLCSTAYQVPVDENTRCVASVSLRFSSTLRVRQQISTTLFRYPRVRRFLLLGWLNEAPCVKTTPQMTRFRDVQQATSNNFGYSLN